MAELEIRKKRYSLCHAHVAIDFEANIGYGFSWLNDSHDVFCDYVQSWSLFNIRKSLEKNSGCEFD